MHPLEPNRKATPGVKASLKVLLKEGWRLAPGHRAFVHADGDEAPLKGVLPSRAKVVATAPSLTKADLAELSEAERYLARHVQVVLPSASTAQKCADALNQLDAVEEVQSQPMLELP